MERTRNVVLTCRNGLSSGHWKLMTTKASNRAAVHGAKLPKPDIIDVKQIHITKDEVEGETQKAKEEKEAKRKQIEKTVESHMNSSKSDHSSSDG